MNKSKVTLTAVLVISTLLLLGSCTALIKEIREEPIYKTAPEETKPEKKPLRQLKLSRRRMKASWRPPSRKYTVW